LKGYAVALEKSLQRQMETNLETLLGIQFIDSEYVTGKTHGGRIDTLGIDENGFPVIIEYKRAINENVINQGLFYIDWLLDHKGEFELKVLKKLGSKWQERIDWSNPRLLCIAGDFTKYDIHAVQQINRNIELIRYRKFEPDLLLLELINATSIQVQKEPDVPDSVIKTSVYKTVQKTRDQADQEVRDRYEGLKAFMLALGDDVQETVLKYYVAFKRIKNFACVEFRSLTPGIVVYVKVDPDSIELKEGFTKDARKGSHYGTGDLEIFIRSDEDLERAKELIVRSYEEN
jgi:predicted transport protein